MLRSIIVLLCCAVDVGVLYADTYSAIDFENAYLRKNCRPEYGLDDTGSYDTSDTYWSFEGDTNNNASVIRSYNNRDGKYSKYDDSTNPKPEWQHESAENLGALDVDAANDSVLWRSFKKTLSATGSAKYTTIPSSGLYFDSQIKFTPYLEGGYEPQAAASSGYKFVFWLDATGGANVPGRLMIAAGSVEADGNVVPVSYRTAIEVPVGDWVRLTVKLVSNVATRGEREYVGFMAWIDGQQVVCEEEDYTIGAGAARFEGNTAYEQRALFLSLQMIGSGTGNLNAKRLYAVGGSGGLMMDELALVNDNPFAKSTNELTSVIVCEDERLKSLKWVLERDGNITTNELTAPYSGTTIKTEPGDVVTLLPVVAADNLLGSKLRVSGNSCASLRNVAPYYTVVYADEFTDDSRVTLSIPIEGSNFRFMGEEYGTFNEIVQQVIQGRGNGETVELVQNVTLDADAEADNGQLWVKPGANLVLDLKGKCIKGEHYRDEAAVYSQGGLVIVDSVGGGSIVAPGNAIEVALDNDAINVNYKSAKLQLGTEESALGNFAVTGVVRYTEGELKIMAGEYANPGGVVSNEFYLAEYVVNDGRFTWKGIDGNRAYRVENAGDSHLVKFELDHGKVTPTNLILVADGEAIEESKVQVVAPGYTTVWYNGETLYDFTLPVTSNMTLTARQTANEYSIEYYDNGELQTIYTPTEYTVEMSKTALATLKRDLRVFEGWKDRISGYKVDYVGSGAVFVDTEEPVTGDLKLDAVWSNQQFVWTNAGEGNVESNGVYGGSWTLRIPTSTDLPAGTPVKINQIGFSVVNPVTYPKTASYLEVTTNGASGVTLSKPWNQESYLGENDEYIVKRDRQLGNRRPQVIYEFTDLVVRAGVENTLRFTSDDQGTSIEGFLRLVMTDPLNSGVIGNCNAASAPSEEYGDFRPVYEVKGEAWHE